MRDIVPSVPRQTGDRQGQHPRGCVPLSLGPPHLCPSPEVVRPTTSWCGTGARRRSRWEGSALDCDHQPPPTTPKPTVTTSPRVITAAPLTAFDGTPRPPRRSGSGSAPRPRDDLEARCITTTSWGQQWIGWDQRHHGPGGLRLVRCSSGTRSRLDALRALPAARGPVVARRGAYGHAAGSGLHRQGSASKIAHRPAQGVHEVPHRPVRSR